MDDANNNLADPLLDRKTTRLYADTAMTGVTFSYAPVLRDFERASFIEVGNITDSKIDLSCDESPMQWGNYLIHCESPVTLRLTIDPTIMYTTGHSKERALILVQPHGFWYAPFAIINPTPVYVGETAQRIFECVLQPYQYCGKSTVLEYKEFVTKEKKSSLPTLINLDKYGIATMPKSFCSHCGKNLFRLYRIGDEDNHSFFMCECGLIARPGEPNLIREGGTTK